VNTSTLVQKLWNYCNVLRDDGMSYGDYPRFCEDGLE
jgi:type I restriction enzyme M protein